MHFYRYALLIYIILCKKYARSYHIRVYNFLRIKYAFKIRKNFINFIMYHNDTSSYDVIFYYDTIHLHHSLLSLLFSEAALANRLRCSCLT